MPSLRDSGKFVGRSVAETAAGCGLSFPVSVRELLERAGCPFPRRIRLHLKVLTNPNVAIETMLTRMREVFATAGIRVEVATREGLTPAILGANFTVLNDLDVGECSSAAISTEQNQLFQNQNDVAAIRRATEIIVYFVNSVTRTVNGVSGQLNGCASFPAGLPGAAIAFIASQWTLGHEIGHVLRLGHISGEHTGCPASNPECCSTPDRSRLMTGCSTSAIVGTPTLSATEITTITGSGLVLPG